MARHWQETWLIAVHGRGPLQRLVLAANGRRDCGRSSRRGAEALARADLRHWRFRVTCVSLEAGDETRGAAALVDSAVARVAARNGTRSDARYECSSVVGTRSHSADRRTFLWRSLTKTALLAAAFTFAAITLRIAAYGPPPPNSYWLLLDLPFFSFLMAAMLGCWTNGAKRSLAP